MQSRPSLGLTQHQQLSLTPQLRQALHLLQCSSQELTLEIDQALATNPLLESVDESAATAAEPLESAALPWAQGGPRIVSDDIPEPADTPSLSDHLLQQLHTTRVTARDSLLIEMLIAELDERGYLDFNVEMLAAQLPEGMHISEHEWRIALRLLQSFDPLGVAARDLPECLRLQLQACRDQWPPALFECTLQLVDHLEDLAAGRWGRLCTQLGCDRTQLEAARAVLRQMDPRPTRAWTTDATHYVVPDVLVQGTQGHWRVTLNRAAERPLRLSVDLMAEVEGSILAPALHTQLREARSLMHGLDQRRQTILRVAEYVVERQQDFLARGVKALRPLAQREVAEALGLHESTISRAVRLKYLQTPWGIFELQRFFGVGIRTDSSEETSARAVQALMQELLFAEPANKPLSDMHLTRKLAEHGVVVARRTVAKYRETMGVLPASLRKRG